MSPHVPHAKHPKCPHCGRPLYKVFDGPWNGWKGLSVNPRDPWRFCRNEACTEFGPRGISFEAAKAIGYDKPLPRIKVRKLTPLPGEQQRTFDRLTHVPPPPEAPEDVPVEKAQAPTRAASSRKAAPKAKAPAKTAPKAAEMAKEEPKEPAAIRKARERIAEMVKAAASGAPAESIGIILAIVSQETGNHAAANVLIKEHKLDTLFGIQPQAERAKEAPKA